MPLSWNEIKSRAIIFAKDWEDERSEDAEAKTFWDGFFSVFDMTRRRLAKFEFEVEKRGGKGYIDLFWPGTLIVEHKSLGKDLDKAHEQAFGYFDGLTEKDLPKYILVSDFARIRLYDLETGMETEFPLKDLPKKVHLFAFIAGYKKQEEYKEEDEVNIKAAELMGKLYDAMIEAGYSGHDLDVLLVRILFCLFADDARIFLPHQFRRYIEGRTSTDGSDLGMHLEMLFQVLNTSRDKRQNTLDEELVAFEYVNGGLFEEKISIPSFTSAMRTRLLDASAFNWSAISPAIFGSLFQSVMDRGARRHLGAHYTSEKNIMKLIRPLFLDELQRELDACGKDTKRLNDFHEKLASLKLLDPACGCGNFLIIAFRELRLLEVEIFKRRYGTASMLPMYEVHGFVRVRPEQFFGIEIEEFPARIAQTAMWLMDHQMNELASQTLGRNIPDLPLTRGATIAIGNALQLNWESVVPKRELSYILGNPPFIGHHLQTVEQKADLHHVLDGISQAGIMDYVSAWYVKAAAMMQGTGIKTAFVSTNSIIQGEQVGVLWSHLFSQFGTKIHFAHKTFKWSNEARGKAAVYCVIIGFSDFDTETKYLYEYENVKGEPHEVKVKNINPYLVDAPDILLENQTNPICDVPGMMYGSKPTDGGGFLFTDEEKVAFLQQEPGAAKFIRPFISAEEFLHNKKRWCLWLVDAEPQEVQNLPMVRERVERVRAFRAASKAASTREYPYHTLFRQVTQPQSDYVLVPRTTSESRRYIPMGFFDRDAIVSDTCQSIPSATLYHFGVLESLMHMTWVNYVCGRLESRYRYSKDIVYNNFPWPKNPGEKKMKAIETAAQVVLDTRARYPESSLADLYDPLSMPADLVHAHQTLDRAVDSAYGKRSFATAADRMNFLFDLYREYVVE